MKSKQKNMIDKIVQNVFRFNLSDMKSVVLYRNIFLSFGIKGLAILVSLVNMPLFMDYFQDANVLGLWFALLSMLNWILTFDLGIGNGLRNYLVIALEKKDAQECRRLISSAYCSVGVIALLLSLAAYFIVPLLDWNSVFNIPVASVDPQILAHVVEVLLIGVLLQFLLKIINAILYAMQQSAIPNFLLLIANVLLLLSTFVLRTEDIQQNLIRLGYAYILTSNLPMLVTTILVFATKLREQGIRLACWTREHTSKIIKLGSNFLLLQLLSLASFNTREFYIMRFVSPDGVVPYQVYHKVFSLISTFFVLATTPLWSAITQAAAQQDMSWIKRTYRKGCKLFAMFSCSSLIVILLAQILVNLWLKQKAIVIFPLYSLLFSVVNIEYMWISLHSHFENGLGKLRIQKLGYIAAACLLPTISFVLTQNEGTWITIVLANAIALLPLCVMQPIYFRQTISNMEN